MAIEAVCGVEGLRRTNAAEEAAEEVEEEEERLACTLAKTMQRDLRKTVAKPVILIFRAHQYGFNVADCFISHLKPGDVEHIR